MLRQGQIRQYERVMHEAENGSTQEKVNARRACVDIVKTLLAEIRENGVALMIARIDELETELAARRREEVSECLPPPMARKQVRMDFSQVQPDTGKMAAAGRDG